MHSLSRRENLEHAAHGHHHRTVRAAMTPTEGLPPDDASAADASAAEAPAGAVAAGALPRDSAARMRRDTVLTVAVQAGNLLAGLVLNVVVAHTLTTEWVAAVSWALTAAMFLSAVGSVGTFGAAVPLIRSRPQTEWSQTFVRLLAAGTGASVVCAALWWAVIGPWLGQHSGDEYRRLVPLVAVWIPIGAAASVTEAGARAMGRFGTSTTLAGDWVRRLAVMAAVVAFAHLGSGWSLPASLLLATVAEVVALAIAAWRLGTRPAGTPDGPGGGVADATRRAVVFLPGTVAALTVPQAGVWLLAVVSTPTQVARLTFAYRLSSLLALSAFAAGRVLAPRIAGARDLRALQPVMRGVTGITTALSLIVFGGLAVLGSPLLGVAFGNQYRPAYAAMLVMAIGPLATVATGFSGMCLTHRGHARVVAAISMTAIVAFGAGTLAFGHRFGALGVATVSSAVLVTMNLVMALAVRRRLGVNTLPAFGRRAWRDAVSALPAR